MTRPLSEHAEARVFLWLRTRTALRTIEQLLATARLRVGLAVIMSAIFWLAMFAVMYEGFLFLENEAGLFSRDTIEKVFNLFYASLMVMLLFSSGIILYGGIYRSAEVDFLLTTPTRPERIFTYKFQEAILLSSWGFLLLGSPMLLAYGIVADAPWYYYALLIPFMVAFVFIPSGVGAIGCLLVVYHLTKVRKPLTVLCLVAVVAGSTWAGYSTLFGQRNDLLTPEWFEETMTRLSVIENRWFPSWWLSSGLLEAARSTSKSLDHRPWAEAVLFLALLCSNALFFHLVAVWTSSRIYPSSYSRLQTDRTRGRVTRLSWIDRAVPKVMILAPPKVRLLLVKDLRIFRRDPVQWAEFLIFFGLLILYFLNMQNIRYSSTFSGWVHVVSFLNLTVVGLILSTFTTRFVFPLISLEGRRFWILGLLPVDRETILWGKYIFATIGTLVPSCGLVLMSDLMLGISWRVILVHQLGCVILCSGLAAIAVGLGACMPDLRETNPSKIAAGFGGTLNLVVSAIYILVIVALTAVPSHVALLATQGRFQSWQPTWIRASVASGILAALAIGAISTYVPLKIGFRAFRRLEF